MKEVDVMSPARWTAIWGSLDSAMKERSREVTQFRYLNQTVLGSSLVPYNSGLCWRGIERHLPKPSSPYKLFVTVSSFLQHILECLGGGLSLEKGQSWASRDRSYNDSSEGIKTRIFWSPASSITAPYNQSSAPHFPFIRQEKREGPGFRCLEAQFPHP